MTMTATRHHTQRELVCPYVTHIAHAWMPPPPNMMCLEHLSTETSKGHPNLLSEPPHLAPLMEEQQLYSEPFSDNIIYHTHEVNCMPILTEKKTECLMSILIQNKQCVMRSKITEV